MSNYFVPARVAKSTLKNRPNCVGKCQTGQWYTTFFCDKTPEGWKPWKVGKGKLGWEGGPWKDFEAFQLLLKSQVNSGLPKFCQVIIWHLLKLWEPAYDIFVLRFRPKITVFGCLANALAPLPFAPESCSMAQTDRQI